MIVDDSAPRNSWMMGRVLKTMPDTKGPVRSVSVQTKNTEQYSSLTFFEHVFFTVTFHFSKQLKLNLETCF